MPKDAKLPDVEIKKHNFNSEMQEQIAHEIVETWEEEGPTPYSKLEEKYGTASASHYGNVMDVYLGPKDHDITVEEIRAQYGAVSDYLEQRKRDEIDKDIREFTQTELEERDKRLIAEGEKKGYSKGYRDGYADGRKDGESERVDMLSGIAGIDD